MVNHSVEIRRGIPDLHRNQGIVERWNRTLAERLFAGQYAAEIADTSKRSTKWVNELPAVVRAQNLETTRSTGRRPIDAIKSSTVKTKAINYKRPVGLTENPLPLGVKVRYLYQDGELEGGRRRATDPNWSLTKHTISRSVASKNDPRLYYLNDGPKRSFFREELLIIPQ